MWVPQTKGTAVTLQVAITGMAREPRIQQTVAVDPMVMATDMEVATTTIITMDRHISKSTARVGQALLPG